MTIKSTEFRYYIKDVNNNPLEWRFLVQFGSSLESREMVLVFFVQQMFKWGMASTQTSEFDKKKLTANHIVMTCSIFQMQFLE